MWRNYVTVGLRALAKNKTYAFINIFGLAIGLAACLMILLYVRYETSYDRALPNAENSYQLQAWYTSRETGEKMNLQMTSYSSGAALQRAQLRLLAVLSAVALLIAGVGIHGLLAFTVARRSRELAVRRALGAEPGGIVRLVVGEGLGLAAVGVGAGVALAYPAARAMGALLAGVSPADPPTLGAVAVLCLLTTLVGCLRPAVRAAHIAPLTALRAE